MQLVSLSGLKRSGKNAAGDALTLLGWQGFAFADAVRDACLAFDPHVYAPWEHDREEYRRLSEVVNAIGWDDAKDAYDDVREAMQRMGTEVGRMVLGPDCWVDIVERKLDACDGHAFITDCRFPNELAMVKRRDGLRVWVERPGLVAADGHASENSISASDCDVVVVNDGTLAELHRKIRWLV